MQAGRSGTEITNGYVYSEKFVTLYDKEIAYPDILYWNSSGTTGSVSLSSSISNYNFIEIIYADDWGYEKSEKVYTNGNSSVNVSLTAQRVSDGNLNSQNSLITISGSTITRQTSYTGTYTSWDNSVTLTRVGLIKYVVGYK